MTNSWTDIANSTFVLVWGANPTENHPACMAHINRARFPKDYFTDARANKTPAKLWVVDPRKSRTAVVADRHIRIRPGTDIAFANGLLKHMIDKIDAGVAGAAVKNAFYAYLNQAGTGTFYTDGASGTGASVAITDESVTLSGNVGRLANAGVASVVVKDSTGTTTYTVATDYTIDAGGTLTRVATGAIASGATLLVSYSYNSSISAATLIPDNSKYTDARFLLNQTGGTASDYQRGVLNAGSSKQISDFPQKSADCRTGNTVYNALRAHLLPYTTAEVANICGCTEADIRDLGDMIIANSRCSSTDGDALAGVAGFQADARDPNYRATTILYAMGITQHTCGAQNVKSFAVLQTIMGNMGRAGGGINALRGIHNVQGSTDMGLLYGNIPGYSGNPAADVTYGQYVDGLWGNPLSGTWRAADADADTLPTAASGRRRMNSSYEDAYNVWAMNLQQRGFHNMTLRWFGDYDGAMTQTTLAGRKPLVDAAYSLWPKGNGHNHIKMFREMIAGRTKALVAWGQNPAVTEPNQGKIREGMRLVDTLIVVDMFETETAKVDRKVGGYTFLFPSAAHVEKAGSATNSGRVLQWRYQARPPAGNSKDDNELLLRFARALDGAGAFSHIKSVWEANSIYGYNAGNLVPVGGVYQRLYADLYGGFLPGTNAFDSTAVSGPVEKATNRPALSSTNVNATYQTVTVSGSEWVAEKVYREFTSASATGGTANNGTIWIYTNGYQTALAKTQLDGFYSAWLVANRAKSRDLEDPGQLGYHKWGYSWLVNRRVLYNNAEVAYDQSDFFMSPDSVSRIFAPKVMPTTLYGAGTVNVPVFNYSRWYRSHGAPTSHVMSDRPLTSASTAATPVSPSAHAYPGRFPGHTEPYESPRPELDAKYGHNTSTATNFDRVNGEAFNLIYSDSAVGQFGLPADGKYPLVLTTIRCVEHFQGGPITRNNTLNVEIEPEPWIELHSMDARTYNIKDGDWVNITTARGNSVDQLAPNYTPSGDPRLDNFNKGFRARVGVGVDSNQRVPRGVVAIPWHWGDVGLSNGSRANDLCIDAGDANTTIPESKACLCKIEKA